MIQLGKEQAAAVPRFVEWYRRRMAGDQSVPPGFVVMGPAGTGKTTLARQLTEAVGLSSEEVAGGALQASAASNLNKATGWDCRSLHRWVYKVESRIGAASWFVVNPKSPLIAFRLLVIDEISQVSVELWNHTIGFGIPVLVLGDPGQLPPVEGNPIAPHLTPDVLLTEIHRQAASSPIIYWSQQVRQGGEVPFGEYRDSYTGDVMLRKLPLEELTERDYTDADVILVNRNDTRLALNAQQRRRLGFRGPLPMCGERVVCRRNQTDFGLINSFSAKVLEQGQEKGRFSYVMTIQVEETGVIVPDRVCSKEALGLPVQPPPPKFLANSLSDMAFGYVHTVHAFIGRQAPHVLVVDEYPHRPGRERWLYTALTRGAQRVTLAVPGR